MYSGADYGLSTETVQAIAVASGYSTSAIGSAAYTINPPAATPTLQPGGGTYTSAQTVTHRRRLRRDDLLHHQRHYAYDRLGGVFRPDQRERRDPASDRDGERRREQHGGGSNL